MNYRRHYDALIKRAANRTLDGYSERHHIEPRCLGGSDAGENIAVLTAEEHYVAHQLLVKMHPSHHGIAHAAAMMANTRTGNKFYGWLRRRYAIARSVLMTGVKRPRTPEHAEKIAAARRGRSFNVGRVATLETRRNISAAKLGKPMRLTDEQRAKRAEAMKGNTHTLGLRHSPETRAKMSASAPRTKTPEHRANMSAARLRYFERLRANV